MPIVKCGQALVFFAHVPRCAGTAVEFYLQDRFGPLAFCDPAFLAPPARQRWSRSSPQHVPAEVLSRLFPPGFFDAGFALVRHPAERLRSVFLFQRDIERRLPARLDFADWIRALPEIRRRRPWHLDNHLRPMDEMVPEACSILRLEDGAAAVVDWIDRISGNRHGPRNLPVKNDLAGRLARTRRRRPGPAPVLDAALLARIAEDYRVDYERFGYAEAPAARSPDP